ncbi:MAG: DUF393 domain-containing protein [Cytophagales bacterium]|nr:DUF393 domain-containing protein [Cytophagales bacterium]
MGTNSEMNNIIFFDGVCNLCNSSINFVIDRDPKLFFKFAPLQSAIAKKMLSPVQVDPSALDGIVYYRDGAIYQKSRAVLEIVKEMKGAWPILYVFVIVPGFVRDLFYNLIARNRYKWFGKQETCRIPTPELKSRFIES